MFLQGIDTNSEIWVETKTNEGKSYFYNARTRETTWTKPEGPNVKVISQDQVEAMAQAASTGTLAPGTTTAAQAALAQANISNKQEGKKERKLNINLFFFFLIWINNNFKMFQLIQMKISRKVVNKVYLLMVYNRLQH